MLDDFAKPEAASSSNHLSLLEPKSGSASNSQDMTALPYKSQPETCSCRENMEQNLNLIDLLDDKSKAPFTLQSSPPPLDKVMNSKHNCFEVASIPAVLEQDVGVPHTPQNPETAQNDTQSLYEDTLLYKDDKRPVTTTEPIKLVYGSDAMLPSEHNHTPKSSDAVPNEDISLSNADIVVPQLEEANVPPFR